MRTHRLIHLAHRHPLAAAGLRGVLSTATVVVLVCATAAPASATVTRFVNGNNVTLLSDAASDNIVVFCTAGTATQGGVGLLPCAQMETLTVRAEDGTDTVDLGNLTRADFPALRATATYVDDFTGDVEFVTGSAASDQITADSFDVVSSGDGDDRVWGGAQVLTGSGDDIVDRPYGQVYTGPGDDLVDGLSEVMSGGPGLDTVRITLLGWDGDFLTMTLGPASVMFTTLQGPGSGQVTEFEVFELYLKGGVDGPSSVDAQAFPGRVVVTTGAGDDSVLGSASGDVLDGATGNDLVRGGPGMDALHGGDGDDALEAQDGEVDSVHCGSGTDSVVADTQDVLVGCEQVSLPPPETGKVKGPKKVVKGSKPTYIFASPTSAASFQCRVDQGPWKACASPFKLKTKKLKASKSGQKHTIWVRAVQPTGNPDPTPSQRTIKVVTP